jgi:hypothetical protein
MKSLVRIIALSLVGSASAQRSISACLQQDYPAPGSAEAIAKTPDGEDPIGNDGKLIIPAQVVKLARQYRASSNDPTLSKQLAAEFVVLGNRVMYKSGAAPRVKYPMALRLYRTAGALDSGNKEAADCISLIESIYEQIGQPTPEGSYPIPE